MSRRCKAEAAAWAHAAVVWTLPDPDPTEAYTGPSSFRIGDLTEYFVKATFADTTTATFPEGSFVGGTHDGDIVTVVAA